MNTILYIAACIVGAAVLTTFFFQCIALIEGKTKNVNFYLLAFGVMVFVLLFVGYNNGKAQTIENISLSEVYTEGYILTVEGEDYYYTFD